MITTRHGQAHQWHDATRHRLDTLDIADAVDVLRDLAPDHQDRAVLEELARRLGCHPLALVLAGSYLGHQLLEPVTVDDYRGPNVIIFRAHAWESLIAAIQEGALT
ncbi:hypothetical protein [Streptomyces regalis]|uniref:Uncharacterized protein n=1 Tax=Streptomyces regalis TaxID=68262 RepID=A0A0X3VR97_9ACTN|nr:hypothetical protein [Streptomyces regalis]KUL46802.1 hypothetical protein ADL12_01905 [Streptomyces regalis]